MLHKHSQSLTTEYRGQEKLLWPNRSSATNTKLQFSFQIQIQFPYIIQGPEAENRIQRQICMVQTENLNQTKGENPQAQIQIQIKGLNVQNTAVWMYRENVIGNKV